MVRDLPPRQAEALKVISTHIERLGYPPTLHEVAAAMGVSVHGAEKHVLALAGKGVIRKSPGTARGIAIAASDG